MEAYLDAATKLTLEWQEKMEQYEREYLERGGPEPDVEETESESELDAQALRQYSEFREPWIAMWSPYHGSFEDATGIACMRYTHEPAPPLLLSCNTLQIFSARVAGLQHGLHWPLDVYGMVAVRDAVDRNRNIIFYRKRDSCQTLTEKDPFLVLTGPTRAVVLTDPVTFEVDLKVKGATESEDKVLSLLAEPLILHNPSTFGSRVFYEDYTSTRSTLEFTFANIGRSVEATITIRITDGSWPDGFHGQFAARTTGIDHDKVILLDFGDEDNAYVTGDGNIMLSRRVVSVGVRGKLKVSVVAWQDDYVVVEEDEVDITPNDAGLSSGLHRLRVGSCQMEVTVAWSLISSDPEPA